jgi:hypothetical protein
MRKPLLIISIFLFILFVSYFILYYGRSELSDVDEVINLCRASVQNTKVNDFLRNRTVIMYNFTGFVKGCGEPSAFIKQGPIQFLENCIKGKAVYHYGSDYMVILENRTHYLVYIFVLEAYPFHSKGIFKGIRCIAIYNKRGAEGLLKPDVFYHAWEGRRVNGSAIVYYSPVRDEKQMMILISSHWFPQYWTEELVSKRRIYVEAPIFGIAWNVSMEFIKEINTNNRSIVVVKYTYPESSFIYCVDRKTGIPLAWISHNNKPTYYEHLAEIGNMSRWPYLAEMLEEQKCIDAETGEVIKP